MFNYGAQAYTQHAQLSEGEKKHTDTPPPLLTNEWMADRMDELLNYVNASGQMLLSSPFHLMGFGFGACLAGAFAAKYAKQPK